MEADVTIVVVASTCPIENLCRRIGALAYQLLNADVQSLLSKQEYLKHKFTVQNPPHLRSKAVGTVELHVASFCLSCNSTVIEFTSCS